MASPRSARLDTLDDEYAQFVQRALRNILSTDLAEFTYAQILDGLPTERSILESCQWIHDHPLFELKHEDLCDGFLDKARKFRSHFDPLTLNFPRGAVEAFQNSCPSSKEFNLRLIELVVIACHQIGAYLFELDDGAHKHELHSTWQAKALEEEETGKTCRSYIPPPAAFFHRFYEDDDQYPRGVADVAGYWAEGRIFGGVVVFDRGESEQECNGMWIHGILEKGPRTLYPPTANQFKALMNFLTADLSANPVDCPLPIHGTPMNRPRWDPTVSMRFHIFRDRYERKPAMPPPRHVNHTTLNWPELMDNFITLELMIKKQMGEPIDEEKWKKACEGLNLVTESSPMWPPSRSSRP